MKRDRLSRVVRILLPIVIALASAARADANHAHVPLDLHLFVDYSLSLLPDREEDSRRLIEALDGLHRQLVARAGSVPKTADVDYVRVFLFADRVSVGGWGATVREPQFDSRWQDLLEAIRNPEAIRSPRPASGDQIGKELNRNLTDFSGVFERLRRPTYQTFGHPAAILVTNGVHDTGQKRRCDQYYLIHGPEKDYLRTAVEGIELRTAFLNTPCAQVDGYPLHPFATTWRGLTNRHLELFLSRDPSQPLKSVRETVVNALHFLEAEIVLAAPEAATTFGRKALVWKVHVGARVPANFRLCFDSQSIELKDATGVRLEFGRDLSLDAPASRATSGGGTTCQAFDVTADVRDVEVRMLFAASKIPEIANHTVAGTIRAMVNSNHQLYPDTLALVFRYGLPPFTGWFFDDKFALAAMAVLFIASLALIVAALQSRYGFGALGWDVTGKVHPVLEPGEAPRVWAPPARPEDFSFWSGFFISPCLLVTQAGGGQSDVKLAPSDAIRCWPISETGLAVIATRNSSIGYFLIGDYSKTLDVSRRQVIRADDGRKPLWLQQKGERGARKTAPVGITLEWKRRPGLREWLKRALTVGSVAGLRKSAWILAIVSFAWLGVAASIATWYGMWREWAGFVSVASTLAMAVTTVYWPKLGHLLHIHGLLERLSDFPELLTDLHRH